MSGRLIADVLHGHSICLFCAFRPRPSTSVQANHARRQLRRIATTPSRTQATAAAARQDEDDDDDFSMLKQNASLSTVFPTRHKQKANPIQPSDASQVPRASADTSSLRPPSSSTRTAEAGFKIRYDVTDTQSTRSTQPGTRPAGQQRNRVGNGQVSSTDRPGAGSFTKQFAVDRRGNTSAIDERPQRNVQPGRSHTDGQASNRNEQGSAERKSNYGYWHMSINQPGRTPPSSNLRADGVSASEDGKGKTWRGTAFEQNSDRGSNLQDPRRQRFAYTGGNNNAQTQHSYRQNPRPFSRGEGSHDSYSFQINNRRQGLEGPASRNPRQDPTSSTTSNSFPRRTSAHTRPAQQQDVKPTIPQAELADTEAETGIEIDGIDAPAGSSFSSAYEHGTSRRGWREQKAKRIQRFADVNEEDIDSTIPKKVGSARSILDIELAQAEDLLYGERGRKKKNGKAQKRVTPVEPSRPIAHIPEFVSVERLARLLKMNVDRLVEKLEEEGYEGARYDHVLDSGTSAMFADLYGFEPVTAGPGPTEDLKPRAAAEDPSSLPSRPPIVTIMGHVDHGKTTILDFLRKSSVVATEHGGITQHIGAFSVTMPGTNRQITFLDTPGHAAFLEMRRRGANVTDIVVLVVAADDSVKPQTIEAIKHALAAKVQLIVAINKIDKQDADIERVKQDLMQHEIVVEDYGGDYQVIPVSGKTGEGMDALEEAIITLADVSDFRAEIDGPAEGWVLESKVTAAGRVATVLVRRGTLRTSDFIVAGTTWARVKTLRNDAGMLVTEASPGTPVQVDGWRAGDPSAGLEVLQAENEDHAKEVIELRLEQQEISKTATDLTALNNTKSEEAEARAKVLSWEADQDWAKKTWGLRPKDNEGWVEAEASTGKKQVPFLVKADVAGSVEAVVAAVAAIGNNEIGANIIHSAVGELTESDIRRLAATGEIGYVVNFNQHIDGSIARLAQAANLQILDHNIIYKVTDDVKERMAAELPPLITQRVTGEAEVGQVFEVTIKKNKVKIAGCRVTNGTIARAHRVRVIRRGQTVYTGTLQSLKNVKRDVTEMRKGNECGMGFENWEDFAEGDQVQCFEETEEKRTLY